MDPLTVSIVALAAASLLLPLLQLTERGRGRLPGYVLAAVLAAVMAMVALYTTSPVQTPLFGSLLAADQLGGVFALIMLGVTLMVTLVTFDYRRSVNGAVFYSLLSFTALGMLILSYSQDLLILFVAWELMSLPTYVLAGFDKKEHSNEAAVKYAVIGAMSSAIILYAISLAYGLTGYTQISSVVQGLASQPPVLSAMVTLLFIAGFGFKMAVVPFHMWIPDAYEGSPPTVATLLAAATKKGGFIAAIRVVLAIATFSAVLGNSFFGSTGVMIADVLAVLALLTMTVGNAAALTQKSMTRLLAYSSIAQAGYILVGFVPFAYGPASLAASVGVTGSIMQIVNHAVMKGAAFLVAALVLLTLKRGDLDAYNGLGKRMPIAAFTMAVAFLALAGVPPLNGFWGKLFLFLSVANGPFTWLAIAGILNSAFSLGYYAWVIKRMYIDDAPDETRVKEPFWFVLVFAVSVGLMIGLGVFPQLLINLSSSAAGAVLP
jgi:NADH-quinone oxidoreductase subunit N